MQVNSGKTWYKFIPCMWKITKDWSKTILGWLWVFSKWKWISKSEILEQWFPCVRYWEIYTKHHYVIKNFYSFIDKKSALNSYKISKSDILFAGSGETIEEIWKSVAFIWTQEAYAWWDVIVLSPNDNIDPAFLSHLLEIDYVRKQKRRIGQWNSVVHIYPKGLSEIELLIPELLEQQRIAQILSAWDSWIQTMKDIIKKLEQRNKGLMQKLLTGKKRLKWFNDDWKEVYIWSFSKEFSKKNKEDKDLVVLSCTKYDGLVPSLEYFGRKIYSNNLTTYKIVPLNSFAYATNHIEEWSIGYQEQLEEAVISPMYTVFQTDNSIEDSFIFKLLKSHRLIYEYQSRMEWSIDRRGWLRWKDFAKIKVTVPSREEQIEIMKIVEKSWEELSLYKEKLKQLELQKKGLMQQLLTGKTRVKI